MINKCGVALAAILFTLPAGLAGCDDKDEVDVNVNDDSAADRIDDAAANAENRINEAVQDTQAELDATKEELNDAREELENERNDDVNVIIEPDSVN